MIQPQHLTLSEMLSNRLFRIPQYQRSYSWTTRQRKDLFDDIKESYAAEDSHEHFMATVVALRREAVPIPGSPTEHQKVDIVDGQQRITTLILLLKAIYQAILRPELDAPEKGICEYIEKLLVKADGTQLLLQTNHDASDYFANYMRFGDRPEPDQARTLADRQLLQAIKDCEGFVKDWTRQGNGLDLLIFHLLNRLTFIFHEINDERLVYTVFEVLNSRGLPVSWFDRLKSILMGIVFQSQGTTNDLIDEMHNLWAEIYQILGLRIGLSTEVLRFAATLYGDSMPSRALGEEDSVDLLREKAIGGAKQVIEVTKWMKSVAAAVDEVHKNQRLNAVTDIQQARLVATAVKLAPHLAEEEKNRVLRRWEKVTFRIYGMFGKDARTAVGNFTRLGWRIARGGISTEGVMQELAEIGQEYPIDKAIAQLRQADCYEGWTNELRYFFHRYEEHLARMGGQKFENEHWNHIWSVTAANSVEHILPQSSGVGHIHWLGNLLLLPPPLNSKLGALKPSEKAKEYRKTGLHIATRAADQCERGWSMNKIKERESELLQWAQTEWAD